MAGYTSIGCALWNWEPWTELDPEPRVLWLGLYTTSEAKRICPGLWHGGIGTMADAVRMPGDVVLKSLDRLIEHGLAEYDQRSRVLRLTRLPDTGERPFNANTIYGWWNRFTTVPACRVRDSHVALVQWLYESGVAAVTKPTMREQMVAAWSERFGTIRIPEVGARLQRLIDSDTGTRTQPSLFSNAVPDLNLPSERNHKDLGSESGVSIPLGQGTGTGTGVGTGSGSGSGSSDQGPDRVTAGPADQAQAGRPTPTPRLELVPPPALAPFSVDDVLEALGVGVAQIREAVVVPDLWSAIAACARAGMGKPDLELLAGYVKAGRLSKRDCVEALTGDRLVTALSRARRWHDEAQAHTERARELSDAFREEREKAGL